MKRAKTTITEHDYLIAQRRASRLIEIEMHGRPVCHRRMLHKSHKSYNRQVAKQVDMD